MALGKSGPPSRRESKDALEYRDDRDVAERRKKHSDARQDDHEESRRRETGRPDWGSMGTRPSKPNPTKVCRKEIFKHGGASIGASRSSRDSLPSALWAPGQPVRPCHDLGRGVSFTLSPSPPRVAGDARCTPSTMAEPP